MSQTRSATGSATYSAVDIENVIRSVKADFLMIADSTSAWTPAKAADYAHDIELLAKAGYLSWIDVTLLSYDAEQKAVRYDVNTDSGSLTSNRPGGVLWPKLSGASLRIVLGVTAAYTDAARDAIRSKLNISWTTTNTDTSHSALTSSGARVYASNAYGMPRKDWAA